MRVSIVRGGGVAGFATRTELESTRLAQDERSEFETRLRRALVIDPQSSSVAALDGDPSCEVTLDDGEARKTMRFSESSLPAPIRSLIDWTDGRSERETLLEGQPGSLT